MSNPDCQVCTDVDCECSKDIFRLWDEVLLTDSKWDIYPTKGDLATLRVLDMKAQAAMAFVVLLENDTVQAVYEGLGEVCRTKLLAKVLTPKEFVQAHPVRYNHGQLVQVLKKLGTL
jgi:hypothetical protein